MNLSSWQTAFERHNKLIDVIRARGFPIGRYDRGGEAVDTSEEQDYNHARHSPNGVISLVIESHALSVKHLLRVVLHCTSDGYATVSLRILSNPIRFDDGEEAFWCHVTWSYRPEKAAEEWEIDLYDEEEFGFDHGLHDVWYGKLKGWSQKQFESPVSEETAIGFIQLILDWFKTQTHLRLVQ